MTPTLLLSGKARFIVYSVIGFVALAVGAIQVGYASLAEPNPPWLTVALAVVPFLAAGLGYTAASHTPKDGSAVPVDVVEDRGAVDSGILVGAAALIIVICGLVWLVQNLG